MRICTFHPTPTSQTNDKPRQASSSWLTTLFSSIQKGFLQLVPCWQAKKTSIKIPALDPSVTHGKLDNGMTYYIKSNAHPAPKTASLQLLVRAGSVNETAEQRGLAHFLEHVVGSETARYGKGEINKYLSSIGCAFGADENAWTSFNETGYRLDIPLHDEAALEKGLEILGEFAWLSKLSTETIEQERTVILDEMNQGKTYSRRFLERLLPMLLEGTPYPDRLPIGLEEVIKNSNPEEIRNFYHLWYQPKNMAVIAVGDFQVEKVKEVVEKVFGAIPASDLPPTKHNYHATPHKETRYLCHTEKEAPFMQVIVHCKKPSYKKTDYVSAKHVEQGMIETFIHKMFSKRLMDMAEEAECPFVYASTKAKENFSGVPISHLSALVKEGRVTESLKTVLTELKRLKTHRFTQEEFEICKASRKAALQHALQEYEKISTSSIVDDLHKHFIEGAPCPDLKTLMEWSLQCLDDLSLQQINAAISDQFPEDNRIVSALVNDKVSLSETDLENVVEEVKKEVVTPYISETVEGPFIKNLPAPGKIISTRPLEGIDGEEWLLENGMRVWIKPTTFKQNTIHVHCSAIGGYRMASPEDTTAARIAESVLDENGLGGFSPKQMNKLFADKHVNAMFRIFPNSRSVSGAGSSADIEAVFQIINQLFRDPQLNAESFEKTKAMVLDNIKNRDANPIVTFTKAITDINTSSHPGSQLLTVEEVEKVTFEQTRAFLQKIYSNPSDFTLFVVGNFDRETLKTYIETYMANLPKGNPIDPGFQKVKFPSQSVIHEVYAGKEGASTAVLTFPSTIADSLTERKLAEFAGDLLVQRLIDRLRLQDAKTYTPTCLLTLAPFPGLSQYEQNKLSIRLTGEESMIGELVRYAKEEIQKLQTEGPTEKEIVDQKTITKEHFRRAMHTNTKWNDILIESARWGYEPQLVETFEAWVDSLDKKQIQQALCQLMPLDHYTQITLFPKKADE